MFAQDGNNVTATGTGSLNVSALIVSQTQDVQQAYIYPHLSIALVGPPTPTLVDDHNGTLNGPLGFGLGGNTAATSGSGNEVGIGLGGFSNGVIYVPTGYVSGTPLTSGSTWDNTTISGLGLTPGTYTWTWGGEVAPDYLEVVIPAPSAVPEPSTLTLLGMATASFAGYFGWRRRKVVVTTT
jgi:hypothetical protein